MRQLPYNNCDKSFLTQTTRIVISPSSSIIYNSLFMVKFTFLFGCGVKSTYDKYPSKKI